MKSIPASQDVSVQPGVLGTGGSPLSLNAVFGTNSTRVPFGAVLGFPTLLAVQNYFGVNSQEALMAKVYFSGFNNCTRLPSALYFSQFNLTPIAGYMRGGSLLGAPLTAITGLSGTMTLSIDGVSTVSANINLAGATSYSNAAALIQTGLQAGTPSNTATVSFDALLGEFVVTSPTTGASSAITVAAVGTLATGLKLTAATGAITSAGAAAATPASWLNSVVAANQNWATFTTTFDPDAGASNGPIKQALAAWANGASPAGSERFMYVGEDVDVAAAAGSDPTSFAGATKTFNGRYAQFSQAPVTITNPDGSFQIVGDTYGKAAAFVCGTTASINWGQKGGRITFKFRGNTNLNPSVVDATVAANLDGNGYNYYSGVATSTEQFQYERQGQISGDWDWADEYVNQIYLNSQFQTSLITFLQNINAISYNQIGYGLIRSALLAPINEATNNGTIVNGVQLSPAQEAALTVAAGTADIVSTLFSQGWYLQILDPGAQARGNRTSPNMTFWYTDGGAVQQLNLASIDVQ